MASPTYADLCRTCDGSGEGDWLTGEACPECRGSGFEPDDDEYGPDDPDFWETFYSEMADRP
jgi:DnaJ-class molecular chaperone